MTITNTNWQAYKVNLLPTGEHILIYHASSRSAVNLHAEACEMAAKGARLVIIPEPQVNEDNPYQYPLIFKD